MPASFAFLKASRTASRSGTPDWLTDPACTISHSEKSTLLTSFSSSSISAPGFLANVNERSPVSSRVTNASVVVASSVSSGTRISILSFLSVFTSSLPKSSFPSLPRKPDPIPFLEILTATFAGAPPGLAV